MEVYDPTIKIILTPEEAVVLRDILRQWKPRKSHTEWDKQVVLTLYESLDGLWEGMPE